MSYKTTSCQIAQNVGKSVERPELGVGFCYWVWTDPRWPVGVLCRDACDLVELYDNNCLSFLLR